MTYTYPDGNNLDVVFTESGHSVIVPDGVNLVFDGIFSNVNYYYTAPSGDYVPVVFDTVYIIPEEDINISFVSGGNLVIISGTVANLIGPVEREIYFYLVSDPSISIGHTTSLEDGTFSISLNIPEGETIRAICSGLLSVKENDKVLSHIVAPS